MKKMQLKNIALLCFLLTAISCSKKNDSSGVASLIIFNAVVGSDMLITSFNGAAPIQWYSTANKLLYGAVRTEFAIDNSNYFNSYSGQQQLAFFKPSDTGTQKSPLINLRIDIPVSTINSLFLTGTIDAPETLLTRDEPPYHAATDSTVGLRFVNLAAGNLKVSVNLAGKPNGSEVAGLSFKSITAFKNYAAEAASGMYVFEFRDLSTGNLLVSFPVDVTDKSLNGGLQNNFRFSNYTIMLYGKPGATGRDALAVNLIRN